MQMTKIDIAVIDRSGSAWLKLAQRRAVGRRGCRGLGSSYAASGNALAPRGVVVQAPRSAGRCQAMPAGLGSFQNGCRDLSVEPQTTSRHTNAKFRPSSRMRRYRRSVRARQRKSTSMEKHQALTKTHCFRRSPLYASYITHGIKRQRNRPLRGNARGGLAPCQ
jgi:hypothetical protein